MAPVEAMLVAWGENPLEAVDVMLLNGIPGNVDLGAVGYGGALMCKVEKGGSGGSDILGVSREVGKYVGTTGVASTGSVTTT